jgi:hypothetical protein
MCDFEIKPMFVKLVLVGRQLSAADKNMAPISSRSASAKKGRISHEFKSPVLKAMRFRCNSFRTKKKSSLN